LGIATFFAMTPGSNAVWKLIPVAHWLPVPWRLQSLLVLSASVVAAHLVSKKVESRTDNLWKLLTLATLLVCAVTGSFAFRALPFLETDRHHEALETGLYEIGQYRPRAAPAPIKREQPAEPCRNPQVSLEGDGNACVIVWENHRKQIEVDLASPGRLDLQLFAFPGWTAIVDGQSWAIDSADSGQITLELPPGTFEVLLELRSTLVRRLAASLSMLSGLGLVVSLLRNRYSQVIPTKAEISKPAGD
jgi:hypothetical protein